MIVIQVKKDVVRFAIMNQAEKEFLEKGFPNASLRNIVKQAGTSIGNFYNYFESKEALFEELVKVEHENFLYFFQHHEQFGGSDSNWDTMDTSKWRQTLFQIIDQMLPDLSYRFVLLMESSQGTSYENTRLTFIEMVKEHFLEHMRRVPFADNGENSIKGSQSAITTYAAVISEQFLDGLLLIIKKHQEKSIRKKLITEHILFYIIGTMGLIGYRNKDD